MRREKADNLATPSEPNPAVFDDWGEAGDEWQEEQKSPGADAEDHEDFDPGPVAATTAPTQPKPPVRLSPEALAARQAAKERAERRQAAQANTDDDAGGSGSQLRCAGDASTSKKAPHPSPQDNPDPEGSDPRRLPKAPTLAPAARAAVPADPSPGIHRTLAACLSSYVKLDEAYRRSAYGETCRCGSCLLCRSKRALGNRRHSPSSS